ncbi:lipase 1-like [Bicyclus anynana]|uniref:Lipase n=1 Tax=Bicyclus anynana TaxID=110368 RepID=A0A6J1NST0_BICAN|nr:lipase 1-like [Bicyclus anynana]
MVFRSHFTLLILSIAITIGNVSTSSLWNSNKNTFLNFTQLSGRYNFWTEEHTVTTDDGYILTVFRMRSKDCFAFKKYPVLLIHGLFQSADTWLDAGPDAGLAYLIANECYDLWVGNQRGNYYARKHVTLNPDRDPIFWKFSIDQMGIYDLPAMVDYILKNTKKDKLSYVGFSQAVGTCLIMCSERSGYCDKVNILIALAPSSRITNMKSVVLRTVFDKFNKLKDVLTSIGVYEVFALGEPVQALVSLLFKSDIFAWVTSSTGLGLFDSPNPGSIDSKTLQQIATHTPSGTSTHTLAQYGQSLETDNFQKFDYGKKLNIETYGTDQAPIYNLSATTAPVVVLYGNNDHVDYIEDVLWMVKQLPNVLEVREIADPLWNHFDMVYSQNIKNLSFPIVSEYLLKYSTA